MVFQIEERVRFGDVDAMGHVNNVTYIRHMETARTEYYMARAGQHALEEMDIILARVACDFRSPAKFGETIIIAVWPTRIGETAFTLAYRLTEKASGRLVAEGETVQVAYDYAMKSKKPIPPTLRALLERELASSG